jgi:hypothetical protein
MACLLQRDSSGPEGSRGVSSDSCASATDTSGQPLGGNNIEGKKNKGGGERASATHNNNNNNKRYSRAPTGGNNMDRTECPPGGHCVKLGCGGGNINSLNEAISTTNLVSKQFVPEIRVLSWYTLLRKVRGTNCFEKKFHDTNCFKNFVVQIGLEAICTTNFCISFL